jgi:hypothetical protein
MGSIGILTLWEYLRHWRQENRILAHFANRRNPGKHDFVDWAFPVGPRAAESTATQMSPLGLTAGSSGRRDNLVDHQVVGTI